MYAYERVLSRTIVYVKRTDGLHSQKNGDLIMLIPTVLFALPNLCWFGENFDRFEGWPLNMMPPNTGSTVIVFLILNSQFPQRKKTENKYIECSIFNIDSTNKGLFFSSTNRTGSHGFGTGRHWIRRGWRGVQTFQR